ncbi:MAG: hypothetical protein K6G50_07430 [bacterium]|nr:hypothetical protein [bacterium]
MSDLKNIIRDIALNHLFSHGRDIDRIVILRESGKDFKGEAWKSKLTICEDFIRYEYKLKNASEYEPHQKWLYKTNNETFPKLFKEVSEEAENILMLEDLQFNDKYERITFVVSYFGTKIKRTVCCDANKQFKKCFDIINKMIQLRENTVF